jgi:hypothetical protein
MGGKDYWGERSGGIGPAPISYPFTPNLSADWFAGWKGNCGARALRGLITALTPRLGGKFKIEVETST